MSDQPWTPERFRALQAALGLTNPEMAARLLMSTGGVRKWRTGKRHPNWHAVRQLEKLEAEVRNERV